MIGLELIVLKVSDALVTFGINWFLQSTVLIVVGLLVGKMLRERGAAVQSAAYRMVLVAVLLCPVTTLFLWQCGYSGWSVPLPQTHVYEQVHNPMPTEANPEPASPFAVPESIGFPVPAPETAMNDVRPVERMPQSANVDSTSNGSSEVATSVKPLPVRSSVTETSTATEMWLFDIKAFGIFAILLSIAWLVVGGILLCRLIGSYQQVERLRRSSVRAEDGETAICCTVAGEIGVRMPELLRTPLLSSPFVIGLLRPAILLPEENPEMPLRDVFLHELAHLHRCDCHWRMLTQISKAAFFFQPLLWLLSRCQDETAEEACDDYVVQAGGSRAGFAQGLVEYAALSMTHLQGGIGIVSRRSMLKRRVERIMDSSRSISTQVGAILLLSMISAGVAGATIIGFVGLNSSTTMAQTKSDATASQTEPKAGSPESRPRLQSTTSSSETTSVIRGRVVEGPRPLVIEQHNPNGTQVIRRPEKLDGLANVHIYWYRFRPNELDPKPPKLIAITDADGRFSFSPPSPPASDDERAGWAYREKIVFRANGHQSVMTSVHALKVAIEGSNHGVVGINHSSGIGVRMFDNDGVHGYQDGKAVITLAPEGEPLRGRLVDMEGQPVVGARIRIRNFVDFGDPKDAYRVPAADTDFIGFEESDALRKTPTPEEQAAFTRENLSELLAYFEEIPRRDTLPSATTDEDGRFKLADIASDQLLQLLVEGEGIAFTEIFATNTKMEKLLMPPDGKQIHQPITVYGNDFMHVAGPTRSVEGRIIDLDTGEPIANAMVGVHQVEGGGFRGLREREHFATRTDADGRYRIAGLPLGKKNAIVAFTLDDNIPYLPARKVVDTTVESLVIDIGLRRGVWAEGRVYDADKDTPLTGEINYWWFRNETDEAQYPDMRGATMYDRYFTNSRGEFRIPVLPTRGILTYTYDGNRLGEGSPVDTFPRGLGVTSIHGASLNAGIETEPSRLLAGNFNFLQEVRPEPGAKTVQVDMGLSSGSRPELQVIMPDGTSAEGKLSESFEVWGLNERWGWQKKKSAHLVVEDLLPGTKRKVFVHDPEKRYVGGAVVDSNSTEATAIKLTTAGSMSGRLLDEDGTPLKDARISPAGHEDGTHGIWAYGKDNYLPTQIRVDEEGNFRVEGLIPGWQYSGTVIVERPDGNRMKTQHIGMAFVDETIEPGEYRDLGDLKILKPDQP